MSAGRPGVNTIGTRRHLAGTADVGEPCQFPPYLLRDGGHYDVRAMTWRKKMREPVLGLCTFWPLRHVVRINDLEQEGKIDMRFDEGVNQELAEEKLIRNMRTWQHGGEAPCTAQWAWTGGQVDKKNVAQWACRGGQVDRENVAQWAWTGDQVDRENAARRDLLIGRDDCVGSQRHVHGPCTGEAQWAWTRGQVDRKNVPQWDLGGGICWDWHIFFVINHDMGPWCQTLMAHTDRRMFCFG